MLSLLHEYANSRAKKNIAVKEVFLFIFISPDILEKLAYQLISFYAESSSTPDLLVFLCPIHNLEECINYLGIKLSTRISLDKLNSFIVI